MLNLDPLIPERIFLSGVSSYHEFNKYKDKKVYKYFRDNTYFRDIIEGKLYFSSPSKFNDLFDTQLYCNDEQIGELDKSVSCIKRNWFIDNEDRNTKYNLTGKDLIYEINNNNYILCFSEINPLSFDSHHMWGLYGGTGFGFVAEYDLETLFKGLHIGQLVCYSVDELTINNGINSLKDFFIQAQSVKYQDDYDPVANMKNCYNTNKEIADLYRLYYMSKDSVWKNEKELRIVASCKTHNANVWKQIKGGCTFKDEKLKSCGIYLGWNNRLPENNIKLPDGMEMYILKKEALDYDKRMFKYDKK